MKRYIKKKNSKSQSHYSDNEIKKKVIYIMNNIMDVHKLSINLDINRCIEYTLMYIGYECVGYVFIYTLMHSCIKPYK